MTDLLTTKQVQTLLRVDRTTIYRMVESGRLPAIRVGKQWRFARPEIERWLATSRVAQVEAQLATSRVDGGNEADDDLRSALPIMCAQLIQDVFAEMLGVMIVVTDMQGRPITQVSNPCGFFVALTEKNPKVLMQCVHTWQQLAGDPSLAPKFSRSEMDLLCARGLIRAGTELKGMVVIGGIAPETWPPSNERLADMAKAFGVTLDDLRASLGAVHRLDRTAQARALQYVQRIADVFSHMIEERSQVLARVKGPERG